MNKAIKQAKISTAIHYAHDNVVVECFQLSSLIKKYSLAHSVTLEKFQQQTGLADIYWQAIYYGFPGQEKNLLQALMEADGFLFFMHGWDGSHRIWEDLPVRLTAKHKRIVCFNLDVNGFGGTPFSNETPNANQCSPAALMASIEYWLNALDLWPTPYRQQKPFYLFIGHSMSGAATFYKDVTNWQDEVYGFYALAPALFCNDVQRQAFYKTVGIGIRLPSFTTVKNALAPHFIDILGTGASRNVKSEHLRIYNQTSFGTLAQTLYVLGTAKTPPYRTDWSRFQVVLGHKDRVVGLDSMLNLLEELNFNSNQIRVALGDHYFFSYDQDSPRSHEQNRRMIYDDLLSFCYRLAEEAKQKNRSGIKHALFSPVIQGNTHF